MENIKKELIDFAQRKSVEEKVIVIPTYCYRENVPFIITLLYEIISSLPTDLMVNVDVKLTELEKEDISSLNLTSKEKKEVLKEAVKKQIFRIKADSDKKFEIMSFMFDELLRGFNEYRAQLNGLGTIAEHAKDLALSKSREIELLSKMQSNNVNLKKKKI